MCRFGVPEYVTAKRKCKYNRGNHYKKNPPQNGGAGASVAIERACRAAVAVVYCYCWPLIYCAFALVERSRANLGGGFGFGSGGIGWWRIFVRRGGNNLYSAMQLSFTRTGK